MRRLTAHTINPATARHNLNGYQTNLASRASLGETADIQPFFYNRYDLAAMCSYYFPDIRTVDSIAHEFVIYGDFKADMIIGDSALARYLLVEFEDGLPNSIFNKTPKTAPDWAKRFEGAFSQVIDWLWKLDDMRSTGDFQRVFGTRDASFQALIIAGKGMNLSDQEKSRLRWRVDKLRVDSKAVSVVSLDDLVADVDFWLTKYFGV
ncbi:Shedu immune nuclease family protein [Methylobacterium nodulans]|uniref:Shedu protein SduA C-terminal domain-containing protein n=1 Tax=Methylobacterium nodulans (strain LMG 21967 / CNCM I-2342 / ORS 2060) TaxID=460265 RepID=B8IQM7_METNO|nr:Shedu immune nuclease family protein [Methylobacterium nodulans]ACL60539.1 hypothetical protein Mnod_5709 [Methylobacterium nodulans ORS 2060]